MKSRSQSRTLALLYCESFTSFPRLSRTCAGVSLQVSLQNPLTNSVLNFALYKHAQIGDIATIKELLSVGADPRSPTFMGRPITAAVSAGHLDIVKLFYRTFSFNGYNIRDYLLSCAAGEGRTSVYEYLAKIYNMSDYCGWHSVCNAAHGGYTETLRCILRYPNGVMYSDLRSLRDDPVVQEHTDVINFLLEVPDLLAPNKCTHTHNCYNKLITE